MLTDNKVRMHEQGVRHSFADLVCHCSESVSSFLSVPGVSPDCTFE
jgi:hypothetical protein